MTVLTKLFPFLIWGGGSTLEFRGQLVVAGSFLTSKIQISRLSSKHSTTEPPGWHSQPTLDTYCQWHPFITRALPRQYLPLTIVPT